MAPTPAPVALQLYTVREALAKDFAGVVRQVAALGYAGIETAGFPGTTVKDAAKLFRDLGLAVTSMHVRLPIDGEAVDTARTLGCTRLVSGLGKDLYTNADLVRQACDQFNQAGATAKANGMTFGIHNHWWEFQKVDGRYGFDMLIERLDPSVFFEVDVYWAQTAGVDPASLVKRLGGRAPVLHIKDGPCTIEEPMLAVGSGKVDVPAVIKAGAGHSEWQIVELDRCATDMLAAVAQSYRYLVGKGLARGNKAA